jgi:hypothetical protein
VAERRLPPTDVEVERALTDLGAHLAYPPTPDLASAVRRRVAARPSPFRRRLAGLAALAALLALLLAVGAIVLFPAASSAVADRLGLRGIKIFYTAAVPTMTPTPLATMTSVPPATPIAVPTALPTPIPTPTPVGAGLRLGEQLRLADARGRVAYAVLTPTAPDLGPPDEVYLGDPPAGGQVSLVYRARPGLPAAAGTGVGLLLTEFHADLASDFFGKGLGPGTRLEEVTVNGERGFWIEGQPHQFFFYLDASGNVHDEHYRLATNTLLWEHNGTTFRLEAPVSKEAALRIAESLR